VKEVGGRGSGGKWTEVKGEWGKGGVSGSIEKERLERLRLAERVVEEEETRVAGRGNESGEGSDYEVGRVVERE